jgi:hypothetical protein
LQGQHRKNQTQDPALHFLRDKAGVDYSLFLLQRSLVDGLRSRSEWALFVALVVECIQSGCIKGVRYRSEPLDELPRKTLLYPLS